MLQNVFLKNLCVQILQKIAHKLGHGTYGPQSSSEFKRTSEDGSWDKVAFLRHEPHFGLHNNTGACRKVTLNLYFTIALCSFKDT